MEIIYRDVKKNESYDIGIVKSWNKSIDNEVCLILKTCIISHNDCFNFCKVLIKKNIHTIPKSFIVKI
jgi:hypothetical protein